jgi:hypothetical protein
MKKDIQAWLKFLEEFNGYCKCSENKWISNEEISFSTDSASAIISVENYPLIRKVMPKQTN